MDIAWTEPATRFDVDDCGVSKALFDFIESLWGPHYVDRFAYMNRKTKTSIRYIEI